MSHKKFGPDRFSRFDVYWIQTDKPNLYIDAQIETLRLVHTNIMEFGIMNYILVNCPECPRT